MVQFLNTESAHSEIDNIINRAERKLALISPHIRLSRLLVQMLSRASEDRDLYITVVCRGKDLKREEYSALRKITGLEILDLPDLHVRCFYNEKSMVIASLDLYDYSRANNREMGVLLTRENDSAAFMDAVNEAEFLTQIAYRMGTFKAPAVTEEKPVPAGDVSFFDIEAGLKRSFPTFARMLSRR